MAKDSRFNGRTVEEMRVYAPNNGSLAYKSDYLYDTRLAAAQPKRRQETAAPAETQPKIRPQKTRIPLSVTLRERKVGIKLTAFLFVALIAMSALLVVLRFERIAGVQRDINEINAGKFDVNAPVYNLAGQRVNANAKGILIQNGKKFIK